MVTSSVGRCLSPALDPGAPSRACLVEGSILHHSTCFGEWSPWLYGCFGSFSS